MSDGMHNQNAGVQPSREAMASSVAVVLADLKPVRRLPSNGVLIGLALLLFILFSLAGSLILQKQGWHLLSASEALVYYFAALACAAILSAGLAPRIVPGTKHRATPWAVLLLPPVVIAITVRVIYPLVDLNNFVALGLPCLVTGLTCAACSGVVVALLLRRGYVVNPVQTYTIAAAFAGFTGVAALISFCPQHNWFHVLIWHLGAPILSALAVLLACLVRAAFQKKRA